MFRVECQVCCVGKSIAATSPSAAKAIAEAAGWQVGVELDRCARHRVPTDVVVAEVTP